MYHDLELYMALYSDYLDDEKKTLQLKGERTFPMYGSYLTTMNLNSGIAAAL